MNVIIPEHNVKHRCRLPHFVPSPRHGDNHSTWLRRTSVERYAAKKNIAVVMPAAQVAWYTDMECGYKNYFTFISKELPESAVPSFRGCRQNGRNLDCRNIHGATER